TRFSRDWSSDVCSSDLIVDHHPDGVGAAFDANGNFLAIVHRVFDDIGQATLDAVAADRCGYIASGFETYGRAGPFETLNDLFGRSEERRVGKTCRSPAR